MTKPRILCIDDDPNACELLKEELEEAGFETILAADGNQAFNLIINNPPQAIVCDISMPRMSGTALRERLNSLGPTYRDIPFVFLTAHFDRNSMLEGRRLGANDYLGKPIDFELLVAILRQHTSRQVAEGTVEEGAPLTARELEALTWSARGKSSADIATLMGISERTVNFHVENATAKLGVATRMQAAVKASRLGLIDA